MNQQTELRPAAIYARVSTERQDADLSISAQLKELRKYAKNNGYIVVREYVDEARSGSDANRPEFAKMLAEANQPDNQPFHAILVWKFSRFSRRREHAVAFKAKLKRRGVRVISISEPADDSPVGAMIEGVIEVLDEFYIGNLSQDVRRGMREAASRGFWVAVHPPYGYRTEYVYDGPKQRPRLVLNPPDDGVVKRMFDMAASGRSVLDIAKALNSEGIASARGKSWNQSVVHYLLRNEAYTGTLIWGKNSSDGAPPIRVEGAFPAIVSCEQFSRVQDQLRAKAPSVMHPRRAASPHLLSGLLKCRSCRRSLVAQGAKSGQYTYYVCNSIQKRGSGACDAPRLNAKRIERLIAVEIRENILTDSNIRDLVRLIGEEMEEVEGEGLLKLKSIEKELDVARRAVQRLWEAVETSDLEVADIVPRLRQHRERQERLERTAEESRALVGERRALLDSVDAVAAYDSELSDLIKSSEVTVARGFIRSFVEKITVGRGEVTIHYTVPASREGSARDPDDEEADLPGQVLPMIRLGPPAGIRTAPQESALASGCAARTTIGSPSERERQIQSGAPFFARPELHASLPRVARNRPRGGSAPGARAARVGAPRVGGGSAHSRIAWRAPADGHYGVRLDRAVVPGDEPGDRPARGGRHPQAGDGRTAKPRVRGPRADRRVHGAGAAAREPRRRHPRLRAGQARPAQAPIKP